MLYCSLKVFPLREHSVIQQDWDNQKVEIYGRNDFKTDALAEYRFIYGQGQVSCGELCSGNNNYQCIA